MKNLKLFVRNIIFISLLLSTEIYSQILFIPFKNETSFNGKWELSKEIPNYIAAYIREFYKVNVLSSTAFISLLPEDADLPLACNDIEFISDFAKDKNFNYVVFGKILSFNIKRYMAGELQVGGYEGYSCLIECDIKIFNLNENRNTFSQTIETKITKDQLGLTILGRPSTEKEQFYGLDKIPFGGEEFASTIVGEAMLTFCEDLSNAIKECDRNILSFNQKKNDNFHLQDKSLDDININAEIVKGQIVTYDEITGEAFINIGSAQRLKVGEEFGVYAVSDSLFDPSTKEFLGLGESKVANLEIIEVRGEKFSLAIVQSNRDKVQKGMIIKKIIIKK